MDLSSFDPAQMDRSFHTDQSLRALALVEAYRHSKRQVDDEGWHHLVDDLMPPVPALDDPGYADTREQIRRLTATLLALAANYSFLLDHAAKGSDEAAQWLAFHRKHIMRGLSPEP